MSYYVGFDVGTQSLKCTVIDENCQILNRICVNYDEELPEFGTKGGVISSTSLVVTTPTLLWVKAFDIVLAKMVAVNFSFANVTAVSFSGQQHGSVYWAIGSERRLRLLNPKETLARQLSESFSVPESPTWMDASTADDCAAMESSVRALANQSLSAVCGSVAQLRFTGPQLRKKFRQNRETMMAKTEAVSLVSSFAASLFLGKVAPIDASDACGTNLVNIRRKDWDENCFKAVVDEDDDGLLRMKDLLSPVVPSDTVLGSISPYFVERFRFSPDCSVVAATGDNPSSLAGIRLRPGDIAVSLGTSDTLFLWLNALPAEMPTEGFLLANPVDRNAYVAMIVFKNGALTREWVRDSVASSSWAEFDRHLDDSSPGNQGNIAFFFNQQEITPEIQGVYRFDSQDKPVTSYQYPSEEVRALIEGQIMGKRIHAEEMGFSFQNMTQTRILATGGASNNLRILQILADVMQAPVYTLNVPDSASLGAALRAKHAVASLKEEVSFADAVEMADDEINLVARPTEGAKQVYEPLLERYRKLEKQICAQPQCE